MGLPSICSRRPWGFSPEARRGSQGASRAAPVKNPPSMQETGSVPGWGRSPGEGNDNPLQYTCLENPMDREAWQATVHGVTKSWTQLK